MADASHESSEHGPERRAGARANDFPYYNGLSQQITGPQWLFVMLGVVAGFAVLAAPIKWPGGSIGAFVPTILFFALPLLALRAVSPVHWRALFRRIRGRDIAMMFGFALLNIAVAIGVGTLVKNLWGAAANPAVGRLQESSALDNVLFLGRTIPQLFGEELISVLPFLALLWLLVGKMGWSRKAGIVMASLLTALLFGAAHLPTYEWNIPQCLIIIAVARLVLLLPYLITKNIWVSTGAHIINDWIMFTSAFVGADATSS
ncbi:MAG: type II CAAX endopeptidase family protein [Planctomycetota bacterium]|nr:CPBP family intramembrane metalloprotease [Planctomycetota bacterium]MCB9901611.1 CPBP family intramembrane metalloprotease [Planctomycetota bacterium]